MELSDRYPTEEVKRAEQFRAQGWEILAVDRGRHFTASRVIPGTTDTIVLVRHTLSALLDRVEREVSEHP